MIFYSKHISLQSDQTEHFPFIVGQVETLCISMPNSEGCFLKYIQASSRIIKVIQGILHDFQQDSQYYQFKSVWAERLGVSARVFMDTGRQSLFENGFPHSLIYLAVVAIQLSVSCKVQDAMSKHEQNTNGQTIRNATYQYIHDFPATW